MAGPGDGTGMDSGGPEKQALTADESAKPNDSGAGYGNGQGGKGATKEDSYTSPAGGK